MPRLVVSSADNEVPRAIAGGALLAMGATAAPGLRVAARRAGAGGARDRAGAARVHRATRATATGWRGAARVARDRGEPWLEYAEMRAAAARALGRRRDAAACRARCARRSTIRPRSCGTAAAHALGRIGDRDAFDALTQQARDDAYDPAQAAAQALAAIDPLRAISVGAARPAPGRTCRRRRPRCAANSMTTFVEAFGVVVIALLRGPQPALHRLHRARLAVDHALPARPLEYAAIDEALASPLTPPISILLPAYNEEAGVVESVHSLLQLRYPEFEIIVDQRRLQGRDARAAARRLRPRRGAAGAARDASRTRRSGDVYVSRATASCWWSTRTTAARRTR